MTKKISVDQADLEQVTTFWETSPHATAFNHPEVLAQLSDDVIWWGVWRSQELITLWPQCINSAGEATTPRFTYYVGPMVSGALESFKYHRAWAIQHEALTALLELMVSLRRSLQFSLPLGFHDVRPWTWWNYDNPNSGQFALVPRHTAQIRGLMRISERKLIASMDQSRRQHIAAGNRAHLVRVQDWTPEEVLLLADNRFLNKKRDGGVMLRKALRQIFPLIETGRAELLAFRHESGELASAMILLFGRYDANNVFYVTSDTARRLNMTPWIIWQGILAARSAGKATFDFNGANSPLRGANKHYYGAQAELYFDVTFQSKRDS